jgi:RHS Repeat
MTDALGRQTTYAYDSQNNLTSVTRLARHRGCRDDELHVRIDLPTARLGYRPAEPHDHLRLRHDRAAALTVTTPAVTTTLRYEDSDLNS